MDISQLNLDELNLGQLRKLLEDVSKEVSKKERIERQAAIDQIYKLAHQFDIPLKSLISVDGQKKNRKPPPNSYRDPNNPDNVWTGRGPRPAWLKNAIAHGGKLEDFAVPAHR